MAMFLDHQIERAEYVHSHRLSNRLREAVPAIYRMIEVHLILVFLLRRVCFSVESNTNTSEVGYKSTCIFPHPLQIWRYDVPANSP